jgi:hypothetical protein
MNLMREMLLIDEHSVFKLYQEMSNIAGYFIAPVFTVALILEYFSDMRFSEVVKKLLLITVFMSAFYHFHTEATNVSLKAASHTLKKVSPNNLFLKKWSEVKLKTRKKASWSVVEAFAIPNLNDFVATTFYVLSKIFIWLLKLIYSSVYHLTYVFSGFTAVLYFLGWTKDALKGTIQASLWCIIMPFVIVAILSLVGNSIDDSAIQSVVLIGKVDNIVWLFGVTLLLLISPTIAFGMIKGDGIHSFGSKMGSMVVNSGIKAMTLYPLLSNRIKGAGFGIKNASNKILREPSIKEMIQKEKTPEKSKMQLVNSKGQIKLPFTAGRPLEERLKAAGITKDEASKLSMISPSTQPPRNHSNSQKSQIIKDNISKAQFVRSEKQTFRFDQKYWNKISPQHRDAIIKKYGLSESKMTSNKIHYPVTSGKRSVPIHGTLKVNNARKSNKSNKGVNP